MFNKYINPRILMIGAAVLFVGIVIAIIATQVWQASSPVTIDKLPTDAKVFINDREVSGSRTNLANGRYTVRAEKSGFATSEQTVLITDTSKSIVVSLSPESDEAKKWAEANSNAYLEQEARTQKQIGEAGAKNVEQNPIIEKLPINNYTYIVGYKLDPKDTSGKSIIVTVDADEGYRNAAVQAIRDLGFDPGDYRIEFSNFVNPFTSPQGAAQ